MRNVSCRFTYWTLGSHMVVSAALWEEVHHCGWALSLYISTSCHACTLCFQCSWKCGQLASCSCQHSAFFTTMDSSPLKPKVKTNVLKLLLVMEFYQSNRKIANTLVSCSVHPRAISQLQYQASRLKTVSKVVSSLEYAGNLSRSGHIDLFLSHISELYYSLGIKMFFKGVYNYLHSSFFKIYFHSSLIYYVQTTFSPPSPTSSFSHSSLPLFLRSTLLCLPSKKSRSPKNINQTRHNRLQ